MWFPLPLAGDADYHGYVRRDFQMAGLSATVVEPRFDAPGRPWIWRMEFFDHRPELDLDLLAKGWRLAYLNVGNTFGAPVPVWRMGQFHQLLTGPNWRLNRRPVLEGFSRGGLYAYNWAAMNPDKVMAIYGDAPVLDFRSWPYRRSPSDWKELIAAYGFPSERVALAHPFCPIDDLEPLALARIPIVHVVGDADSVVPVAENTAIVERRYRALGGVIEVIHKPGVDHHPHSLDDPTPLVRFIQRHQNDSALAPLATMIPAPSQETRSVSAGWQGRSWYDQFRDGERAARSADVALLGDSITQGFGGFERHAGGAGAAALVAALPGRRIANLGISGDRVQHVLWRVEHGDLERWTAKSVVVTIGVNNYPDDSPEAIAVGVENLVRAIRVRRPDLRIVVHGLLGSPENAKTPLGEWVAATNAGLSRRLGDSYFLSPEWTTPESGGPRFARDGVHLTTAGYAVYARSLAEALRRAER